MYTIEELLNMTVETLRYFCTQKNNFIGTALKDERIKKKLLNPENKYETIWLSQEILDEYAVLLFDERGIEILSSSRNLNDKMNGIMTCGKNYVSSLLDNERFCAIIVNNQKKLLEYIGSFNEESSIKFAKYVQENNTELLENVILKISLRHQVQVVRTLNLSFDFIKRIIPKVGKSSCQYLLENDPNTIDFADYNFFEILKIFSKRALIPVCYLEKKEFQTKLTTVESVKDYRFLINNLSLGNNTDSIEAERNKFYDHEITLYNNDAKMLDRYYKFYIEVCQMIDAGKQDYDVLETLLNKYFNSFSSGSSEWNFFRKVRQYYLNGDKDSLEEILINESNFQLSNMIIDYHFKEIPHNFFLDIKQLLKFQNGEGRTLSDEDLDIYTSLLNIDNLSYEDKLKLHYRLKLEDFVSKHYDIFRGAKNKSAELIKEQMLNFSNISEHLDQQLTEKYGVPIYVLDGRDFFALVKSLSVVKCEPLTDKKVLSTVDGGSYSLDGSKKLNTYRDPRKNYNIIFGDFDISTVVHMYPVDSHSRYVRTSASEATSRVFELYTPTELIERSGDYNEIILAQHNSRRIDDDLNDSIGVPKMLGIYCYDDFSDVDVLSAKNLGIGIVVVKTKKYEIDTNDRLSMKDTLSVAYGSRYAESIDYFRNISDDDMITRRK